MKKLFVVYTCIVTIICIALIAHIAVINREHENNMQIMGNNYEIELSELSNENRRLSNENRELSSRVTTLEEQVWNIINGNDYKVSIEHDGVVHTYTCEYDNWGITSTKTHYITK